MEGKKNGKKTPRQQRRFESYRTTASTLVTNDVQLFLEAKFSQCVTGLYVPENLTTFDASNNTEAWRLFKTSYLLQLEQKVALSMSTSPEITISVMKYEIDRRNIAGGICEEQYLDDRNVLQSTSNLENMRNQPSSFEEETIHIDSLPRRRPLKTIVPTCVRRHLTYKDILKESSRFLINIGTSSSEISRTIDGREKSLKDYVSISTLVYSKNNKVAGSFINKVNKYHRMPYQKEILESIESNSLVKELLIESVPEMSIYKPARSKEEKYGLDSLHLKSWAKLKLMKEYSDPVSLVGFDEVSKISDGLLKLMYNLAIRWCPMEDLHKESLVTVLGVSLVESARQDVETRTSRSNRPKVERRKRR